MKIHANSDQAKVVFEKPIEILRKDTWSDVSSPRLDTSPRCSPLKSERRSPPPANVYKPLKRTPPRNHRHLTPDNNIPVIRVQTSDNKNFFMLTKDELLLNNQNRNNLITPDKIAIMNTNEDDVYEVNRIVDYNLVILTPFNN